MWGCKRIAMELKLASLYTLKVLRGSRAYELYCYNARRSRGPFNPLIATRRIQRRQPWKGSSK